MTRFVHFFTSSTPGQSDPEAQGHSSRRCLGKLITSDEAVTDMLINLLGATCQGQRVDRIEIGRPDGTARPETVHTLVTTHHPNKE